MIDSKWLSCTFPRPIHLWYINVKTRLKRFITRVTYTVRQSMIEAYRVREMWWSLDKEANHTVQFPSICRFSFGNLTFGIFLIALWTPNRSHGNIIENGETILFLRLRSVISENLKNLKHVPIAGVESRMTRTSRSHLDVTWRCLNIRMYSRGYLGRLTGRMIL